MAKKNKAPTLEEIREHKLDFVSKFRHKPTILYHIGDRVEYGRHEKSIVTEILENGEILGLHTTSTETDHGRTYITENDHFVAWHDVIPFREKIETPQIHKERFFISYFQTSLDSLLHRFYFNGVNFDPEYQRELCWNLEDKQQLIESIFQDVDIGKFVFRKLPYAPHPAPHCEIVDGKQRLNALLEFYEGRFEWRGMTYYQLHPHDQYHFTGYNISMGELSEDTT